MNSPQEPTPIEPSTNGNGLATSASRRSRASREPVHVTSASQGDSDDGHNMLAIVSDRLSGRWIPAIALGLVLAALFAVLGYKATGVYYDAVGIIQVSPKINPLMRDTPETILTPHYAEQIETEARMVTSNPRILDRALHHLDLEASPWEGMAEAMRGIQSNLGAKTERNTELIYVTFRAESAPFAQQVTNAVLKAYDEIRGSVERDEVRHKMNGLRAERAKYNEQWRRKNDEILEFIASTGFAVDDFRALIESREQIIQNVQVEIRRNEHALQIMTARTSGAGDELPRTDEVVVSERELENFDAELAELGIRRREARLAFSNAQDRLKPEHDGYVAARSHRDLYDRLYQQRAEEVLDEYIANGNLTGAAVNSPDDLRLRIEQLNHEAVEYQALAQRMVRWQATLSSLRSELEQIELWQAEIDHRIRQLDVEADRISAGRIQVAAYAERPLKPAQDRRRAIAAVGGLGGMGMGLGVFFLLGTLDRRVYSARQLAGSTGINRSHGRASDPSQRLLGVLPALPQRSGDFETASVASHCVHQIRNHIEGTRDETGSLVLVVSSPYQGDGKTSLVMALGASYAAIGCRVLLIDCDLVGRNLTTHSMLTGEPGLREALRRYSTEDDSAPETHEITVGPNLNVLPVGHDDTYGPEMIRRERLQAIFDKLRERFDVILVDTGPVFGSVETLPAAATADGVILTMQRGRRHSRLTECIEEIEAVGADYLGLVLNHARASDCDRYVSKSRISAVTTAHAGAAASNGASRSNGSPDRSLSLRSSRNALLRAMQTTSRASSH